MPAPDRYAVIGHPIAHSQSPRIHRLFAQQCQQYLTYTAVDVAPKQVLEWVSNFFASGGRGLNITVPHKRSLLNLPDRLSGRALAAGAINTLIRDPEGQLLGDNTDGIGLVRDLTEHLQVTITAHRVLLMGAGGAARGVVAPLLDLNPAQLVIANRSVNQAQQLASLFPSSNAVRHCGYPELAGLKFDLIVNATAASLQGEVPPLPEGIINGADCVCYDMVYADEPTAFLRWAREHGASRTHNGIGMLIEQAAESFYLWRGLRPNTDKVRAELKG